MRKHIISFCLLSVIAIQGISQPVLKHRMDLKANVNYLYRQVDSNTIILDPLDTLHWQQIVNDDFAFLYSDSVFYDCKIDRIDAFKEGYGILVSSTIDNIPVRGYVISAKGKTTKNRKIRTGKRYKMKLIRYFENPVIRPIEKRPIYDVLIDTNMINIYSTGSFCYLFISPNLNGLSYIEPETVDSIEIIKKNKETEIKSFIYNFANSISNIKDTAFLKQYVDTVALKKVLKKYSGVYPCSPFSEFKRPPRDIEFLSWSNFDIDDSNFESLFWGMLGYRYHYNLPKESALFIEKRITINSVKILNINNNIYTLRIKWSIPNQKKEYRAEISIKETFGSYKVVGFNQSNEHY